MIRLLLLALLVLNLQAKEDVLTIMIQIDNPKESQDTQEFFRAFKVLFTYMQKSFAKIKDARENVPLNDNYDYTLAQIMAGYTDASIPLAKAVVKQVSLFKEFKPKNQREELFLTHVKDKAMFHALDLINMSLEEKATFVAHEFLHINAWLYAPLFNAHKAGLDVIAYLEQLHRIFSKNVDLRRMRNIFVFHEKGLYEEQRKNIVPYKPFRKRLIQDMHEVDIPMDIFAFRIGYPSWVALVMNTIFEGGISANRIPDRRTFWDFMDKNAQRIDPEHLFDLYLARVFPLNRNAPYYYDSLQNDDPKILKNMLKDNPTMCLSPKYLSAQSQQTCLQLFQTQTYNAKDIQEQLHIVRLISIDDSPCVYLDSKDKLQVFKSSNALCVALQEHLEKGLK
ncbi:tRNA methyltransferase [Helicobacter mehlei]|uniref:tRNA methyltransferase n=1 Tax=Helicobacter mehlei TaxID=2316080 RepID=A0A553UWJ8_9HELI|nr:tRNA methyltransferase [Helicobacter mehlei]TSA84585.1 tRNA methyltransferase [Helicobacter mehlei]